MSTFRISYKEPGYETSEVPPEQTLAEELDAANSPLLFGCRTGICGTCVVEAVGKDIPPPDDEERELLEVLAPDNPNARLACQLDVRCDMVLHPLE